MKILKKIKEFFKEPDCEVLSHGDTFPKPPPLKIPNCPECGSSDVEKGSSKWRTGTCYGWWFSFKCKKCHCEFRYKFKEKR